MYYDEGLDLTEERDQDKYINYRIWLVQLLVWCMIVALAKIITFFIILKDHQALYAIG